MQELQFSAPANWVIHLYTHTHPHTSLLTLTLTHTPTHTHTHTHTHPLVHSHIHIHIPKLKSLNRPNIWANLTIVIYKTCDSNKDTNYSANCGSILIAQPRFLLTVKPCFEINVYEFISLYNKFGVWWMFLYLFKFW
jgi:hypothetical protein